jgi:hypothetical protein
MLLTLQEEECMEHSEAGKSGPRSRGLRLCSRLMNHLGFGSEI